jgi:hypothetical protein
VTVSRLLQGNDHLCGIVEDNQAKKVVPTQIADNSGAGFGASSSGWPFMEMDRSRTTAKTAERGRAWVSNFCAVVFATK